MTSHYDELAVAAPVFGDLRNCMTLAMVEALVAHERLIDKAGSAVPAAASRYAQDASSCPRRPRSTAR